MPTLLEILGAPDKRPQVVSDCVLIIDEEVAGKGGLTGLAIKGAYKIVQTVKPGFVRDACDGFLDEFCRALQPLWEEARQKRPVGQFFNAERSRVADALLAVTDARAARSRMATVRSAYEKLRGMAKKHVEEAVPRVGLMIERHAP